MAQERKSLKGVKVTYKCGCTQVIAGSKGWPLKCATHGEGVSSVDPIYT